MTDRLDQEALERVVRRAAELDAQHGPSVEGVDADAVLAAAEEVGISPEAVRTSLALERLGPPLEPARLDRVVGAREVVAERTVSFDADDAFERLDHWLTKGHHLRREQRAGQSGQWRRRGDMAASVARGVKSMAGEAGLSTVRLITAQVSAIDEDRSIIRIVADRSTGRTLAIGTAGGLSALSVGGAIALATAVPPLAVIGIPGLAAAGATTVGAKRSSTKLERELVRLLDLIDDGTRPRTIGRRRARRSKPERG